ncbi:uncharacterized protein LOC122665283 isoform X2 [Telopea speciosissima]|uniref:uncharacterized protein LOC122665283 isoform X2 n=1 Tax=Telopea speciosissima TaxID=54955 RepID=UPI001CC5F250|nr:uncharacterized protein LOC122665283 isoform X2 [Telopea speciosissima]
MMAGTDSSKPSNQQRVRQQGSVPFLWEEKPGTPKKEWKSHSQAITVTTILPPAKLVASVPFKWEEIPGKPLPCFSQPEPDSQFLTLSPVKLNGFPYLSIFSSSTSSSTTTCDKLTNIFQRGIAEDEEEEGGMSEFDLDSLGFHTDESIVVPVQQSPVKGSSQHGTPSSPTSETDSDASSYATGRTSLVGASFLECLFPLISTDCDPEGGCHEMNTSPAQQTKESNGESNCNLLVRRPPTLGELILMSRKRSYNWNATQTRKESLALGFMKMSAFGCCFFGTSGNRIDDLSRGRQMQMLKLS